MPRRGSFGQSNLPTHLRGGTDNLSIHLHVLNCMVQHQSKSELCFELSWSAMVAFITSMYQAKGQDPFDQLPLFLLALLLRFCTSIALRQFPNLSVEMQNRLEFTGNLSRTTSLVLVIWIPLHKKLGWLAYPLCGCPLVLTTILPLKRLYEQVRCRAMEAVRRALLILGSSFTRASPSVVSMQRRRLPV
uniref:Uncharacterized protein n=1 Tax=Nelumbo nucifera TaxID=4432 RepID=A0A822ZQV3_NELNU|nr:TPA_asm: hypothetical protein HUJ06_017549 [Nelumbo nucifera]